MAPDNPSESLPPSYAQSQSAEVGDRKVMEEYDTLLAKALPLVERELGREVTVEELDKLIKVMMEPNDSKKPVMGDRSDEDLNNTARISLQEAAEPRKEKARSKRYPTMDWVCSDGPGSSTTDCNGSAAEDTTYSNPTMMPSRNEQSPSSPVVSCPTNHGTIHTVITDSYNNYGMRYTKDSSARKSSRRSTKG